MNNSRLGLKYGDLETIVAIIAQMPGISRAVVFGSLAKGNYKHGSDIDIAIWTMDDNKTMHLNSLLNDETLLPYKFDIINYAKIDNAELKAHIDRAGIEIFLNTALVYP